MCVNNLEMCVGYDENFNSRMYDHGYDLFGAFYDLAGIYMLNGDLACMTDEKSLDISNKLVADVTSIASVLVGFEGDYAGKTEHITKKQFN